MEGEADLILGLLDDLDVDDCRHRGPIRSVSASVLILVTNGKDRRDPRSYDAFLGPVIDDNFRRDRAGLAFVQMTSHFFEELSRNGARIAKLEALDMPVRITWGGNDPYSTPPWSGTGTLTCSGRRSATFPPVTGCSSTSRRWWLGRCCLDPPMEAPMSFLDTLIARNAAFASAGFSADLKMLPSRKTIILGCVDPRVDPVDVLGLEPGEAVVIRNIGGRINAPLLETMAILRTVAQAAGKDIGPGWYLVVLHHTDCGSIGCLHHAPDQLAKHLGVTLAGSGALAISDTLPRSPSLTRMAGGRDGALGPRLPRACGRNRWMPELPIVA